ncbi:hypothetical protein [Labedella endophytica]|uniref:Lipoprotein n=1 Tax=Labedella endophytica TaxID=1523160 RepID=A0A433JUU4_9MICO|nr:hypothetical protein [Labedella endophytica]RUR01893.1 hypothetical protein ELQ94_10635 [Labedella endophytica]
MQALNKTAILTSATLAGITALLLAGCSTAPDAGDGVDDNAASDGAPPAGVFEFQTPAYGSEGELVIRIPADLLDAAGSDGDGLLVGEVTAKAHELDSSSSCAFDLVVDYRGEGLDALERPSMTEEEYAAQVEDELKAALMRRFGVETVEEAVALAPGGAAEVEEVVANIEQTPYAATPAWWVLDATPIDDLDASDPEPGRYLSDDSKTLTFVQSCASDPLDDGSSDEFDFPVETDGAIETFAFVEMTVMKSGTLTIIDAGVSDYERDSNGDWIGG